jgi:hypothetical protein
LDAADRYRCRQLSCQLPAVDPSSLTVDMSDPKLAHCRGCGQLARPNVSHVTDTDAQIHRERKGAQEQLMVSYLRRHIERNTPLVIIEVGCGTSTHSMREESELLLERAPNMSIIRIDPGGAAVPQGRGVGLEAGALEALVAIERAIEAATQDAAASEPASKRQRGDPLVAD